MGILLTTSWCPDYSFHITFQAWKPAFAISQRSRHLGAMTIIGSNGVLWTIELGSYMAIFREQAASTDKVSNSLSATAVKNRRKTNAISFIGQFLTCLVKCGYILMTLIFSLTLKTDHRRELGAVFRLSQFFIIPLVEILTSPPLRRFVFFLFRLT